jgi:hypothetical protein
MAAPSDVTNLLREASRAGTYERQQELIQAAEDARGQRTAVANAAREVDLGNAIVRDHLTPVPVHEHHTAATDWVGGVDTSGGEGVEREMVAQGSLWYGQLHQAVKTDLDEFSAQASGWARRAAGSFGEQADVAESAFLTHVGTLRAREDRAGMFTESASGVPQVGEPGNPAAGGGLGVGPSQEYGLPGDLTSSNRAPAMQAMESGEGGSYEPVLPQANPDEANGDEGDRSDDTRVAQTPRTAAYNPSSYMDAGSGNESRGVNSPFTRDLSRKIFGDEPSGRHAQPSGHVIDPNGQHVYQVTTGHGNGSGPNFVEHSHEIRSTVPDAHYDAEEAAVDAHAARFGVPRDSVAVTSPARREGEDTNRYGSRKGTASMQTAPCPACQGHGRVAVRTQAASGLDQIDQIADPKDNPSQTPYPTEVAFEWEMDPNAQNKQIQEAEGQIAQREQLKGASRAQLAERAAHQAAQTAYRRVMAGQDDSGWLGDMGAGGNTPGVQDIPGGGPVDSLGYSDPVYGQGGDQGQKDLKPYGADEAADETNNPGMNWQPGQPSQYDQGGRPQQVGSPTAARYANDPQMQQAQRFLAQRAAWLDANR